MAYEMEIYERLGHIEMKLAAIEEDLQASAEEAHTANLIAYLAIVETRKTNDAQALALEKAVRQRLGLV